MGDVEASAMPFRMILQHSVSCDTVCRGTFEILIGLGVPFFFACELEAYLAWTEARVMEVLIQSYVMNGR